MTAHEFQVTFDARDPMGLAEFWAIALRYIVQPPPPGYDDWDDFAQKIGIPEEKRQDLAAIVDPEGVQPRVLFQKVPEDKAVKNRVHLDVNVTANHEAGMVAVAEHVSRLVDAGAAVIREHDDPTGRWVVMTDPEGNEFCVQ